MDLLSEPELLPFLPLLYVAWADGDFSTEERQLLRARLNAQPWLKPRIRELLDGWLSSEHAPSAKQLATVREAIRRASATMSPSSRQQLAELARAMGAADGSVSAPGLTAAQQLAETLGADASSLLLQSEDGGAPVDELFTQPPRFDVTAMQAVLDGPFAHARNRVRAFLSEPEHRAMYGTPTGAYREKVYGWLQELSARGFGDIAYPGVTSKGSLGDFMVTFETLSYGDLSLLVKYGVQFGLFGGSIYFLGTEGQKQALLPKVASLQTPGCFAMSEVGHGSNVADLETVARYDQTTGELVVHTPSESARKDWAGNAALHARMATVFAQLEVAGARHGVHAVLVPIRDEKGEALPGVRIGDCGHKAGLNGVDNGRLWFENVRVPKGNLLGRYARVTDDHQYESSIESPSRRFFTMLGTLVGGRASVAAGGISAAKVGLTIAVRYATARRQFGATSQPETLLLRYPTHQRRLLPALATTYAFSFALEELRQQFLAHPPDADTRELEARTAGLKAAVTWHATQTLQQCREACGGQGYLSVNRLPDLKADSDIFTTFEGDNTVLLQLLAKSLLTGFRQQFSSGGPGSVIRFIAGQVATTITEKNPFVTRGTDPQTLRSADYQLQALRFREGALLSSAARRIQKRIKQKVDPTVALNDVQEHLVAMALAHVDRVVLEAFAKAESAAADGIKDALTRLRALHGLSTLEKHAGWFLADGYMDPSRAKAIRKEVVTLFGELLPDAVPLVNAFGIPEVCLAAPIAFSDPAHPRY